MLFIEDVLFFPLYDFGFFVKNQMFIGVWIYVRVFNSIPLIHMSVFMPILNCFYYYSSVAVLDVRDGDTSKSSFIVQDYLSFPGYFVFPYEVEYCSFKACEELCWDFEGIALSL